MTLGNFGAVARLGPTLNYPKDSLRTTEGVKPDDRAAA
jgi:hypothetical protein